MIGAGRVMLGLLVGWAMLAALPAEAQSNRAGFDSAVAAAKASMLTDTDAARVQAEAAETAACKLRDPTERGLALATALWLQGEASIRLNDEERSAALVEEALATARRAHASGKLMGDILLSSGGVHQARGEVAAALDAYQEAHRIFGRDADARDMARALLSIASLYGDANDYRTSLRYLGQALDVYSGDPSLLLSIYNDRASNLQDLGRYADAEAQYARALALARTMHSDLLEARILGSIARVRLKANDLDGAASAIGQALRLAANGEAASLRPQLTGIDAQLALQRRDLRRAATLIDQRFAGVDLTATSLSAREAHQTAYEVYRALDEAKPAMQHLAALKRLDDQATRLATSANIALAGARFDFANQELRIAELKAEELQRNVAFERARARTQRTIFIGAAGATALVIALLGFGLLTIRRSRDQVRAANDDLAVTNAALGKALTAKTEFLATTSHEIRTPLNGILGMTQVMLADPRLGDETRERLGIVHGAGVTMRALVDDILDVAKMETGKLTIERVPFDLKATIADATRLWGEQARSKGLEFVSDLSACPDRVIGDAARVRQIVFNLLSNALKFTASGHVGLAVSVDEGCYRLVVTDTGIGIPEDKREDIFESFRQADAGTTRQFGGTGLGLAICRNLAEALGGTITVGSVVGQGSVFTVSLPHEPVAVDDRSEGDAPSESVLIVDRNPIARAVLKTLFADRVPGVATAGSVREAEALLAAGGQVLAVVDENILRGEEACAATLVAAARRGGVPLHLLWAGEVPDAIRSAGAASIIAKPIAGAALVARLFDETATDGAIPALVSRAA